MSKQILLIEDNEDLRENTAELLELANYTVLTAENGKIGVAKAKEHLPDLIISDIMMPELDGYGVLRMLGQIPETSTIPFVFLTAKADKTDFRTGMNLGADDYLTKPFNESDLLDIVAIRLKKSESLKKEVSANSEGLDSFISTAEQTSSLQNLSDDRKLSNYKKKEVIYREGDYPSSIYLLNSGKIMVSTEDDGAREYITELISPGDYFGYSDILLKGDRTENAFVLEDSEIYKIPRDDFEKLLFDNKDVAAQFIKILAQNVKEKEERLLRLAFQSVRIRVRDALLFLRDKFKKDDEVLNMAISRDNLASIVGTSPETVIRTLSDFKSEGLIEVYRSEIKIINESGLESMKY
ncbi:MAG: CRP-like cAMP-binding protein [Crocinitomicaceae bacterium]|jgi:CRP-like cAMP-binding protein